MKNQTMETTTAPTETTTAEKIITKLQQEEHYLIGLRDRCVKFNKSGRSVDNVNVAFQRAKMMGMMDICDIMGIDRSQFNWIHNI